MKAIKERDIALFFTGFCWAFLLGILATALLLSSCTASCPAPAALGVQLEAMPDSLPILPYLRQVQCLDSAALAGRLPRDYSSLPAYLVPAPAGSTPRQRRQWQKAQAQNLARAGVLPAKVKNSALATGSGAATDARKSGTRGGSSAVGPGAVATSTSAGVPWWVFILVAVGGALGWEMLTQHALPRTWLPWRMGGR